MLNTWHKYEVVTPNWFTNLAVEVGLVDYNYTHNRGDKRGQNWGDVLSLSCFLIIFLIMVKIEKSGIL